MEKEEILALIKEKLGITISVDTGSGSYNEGSVTVSVKLYLDEEVIASSEDYISLPC